MKKLFFVLLTGFALLACLVVLGGSFLIVGRTLETAANSAPVTVPRLARPAQAVATATPHPQVSVPDVASKPLSELDYSIIDQLVNLDIPRNNPLELVPQFKKIRGTFATPAAPKVYKVGDKEEFWVSRNITGTYELVPATLKYVTPHSYIWLEDGLRVSDASLQAAGEAFEKHIYPTTRSYLGSEPTPGIDNDPRVFILNTRFNGAIGYFSSSDTYPTFVNRYSNQHEMFYMNIGALRPGTDFYSSVLAHEFAHMIHFNQNKREASWITEGFGDLAIQLNDLPLDRATSFSSNPDIQLNAWDSLPNQAIPHYAASFLYLSYLLNRFGDDLIKALVSSGTHDIASVQRALSQVAPGLTFDQVFADWVVANYINDSSQAPRYGYLDQDLKIRPTAGYSDFPASASDTVHQYGTDYIQILPQGRERKFEFDGSDTVQIIPTTPHSGERMWWSSRVDQSDTRLMREIDLTGVDRATLNFWTWYDIEENFDYAYVSVSTDDGQTWTTLPGRSTTMDDPNSANYGNGLTCKSGIGCGSANGQAQWIQEQMDLSEFAGKKILLRFDYITDAIYSAPGFALDDISIPEIGFTDDMETGEQGWTAEGFVRTNNELPQRFIVQAIVFDPQPRVIPIELDSENRGSLPQGIGPGASRVVIAISGSTPITWELANYTYSIQ